jgi:hypothetical protein
VPPPQETKDKMVQKTLFDEEGRAKAIEEPTEYDSDTEEDVKIGIRIAEAEMDHNIREAFNNLNNKAKKKKAKHLLQEITTISLSGDEDDKAVVIFAKVLQLEKVLGIT